MIEYIKTVEEFDKIIAKAKDEKKVVLVDYTASWCGPCKMIAPVLDKFAAEADSSKIEFYKVDVDEAAAISRKAGVSVMPTFRVYNTNNPNPGKDYAEEKGAAPPKLQKLIQASIKSGPVEISVPAQAATPAETAAPEKTTAPEKTAAPAENAGPAETVAPPQTTTPAETAAPEKTTAPEKTAAPAENVGPAETAAPVNTV